MGARATNGFANPLILNSLATTLEAAESAPHWIWARESDIRAGLLAWEPPLERLGGPSRQRRGAEQWTAQHIGATCPDRGADDEGVVMDSRMRDEADARTMRSDMPGRLGGA